MATTKYYRFIRPQATCFSANVAFSGGKSQDVWGLIPGVNHLRFSPKLPGFPPSGSEQARLR